MLLVLFERCCANESILGGGGGGGMLLLFISMSFSLEAFLYAFSNAAVAFEFKLLLWLRDLIDRLLLLRSLVDIDGVLLLSNCNLHCGDDVASLSSPLSIGGGCCCNSLFVDRPLDFDLLLDDALPLDFDRR